MGEPKFSFDDRCLELARVFLADSPYETMDQWELAQAIQDEIENWFFRREKVSARLANQGG